jgi:hypothetical protein
MKVIQASVIVLEITGFHFRLAGTTVILTLDSSYRRVKPENIAYDSPVSKNIFMCKTYNVKIEVSTSLYADLEFHSLHHFSHSPIMTILSAILQGFP